MELPIRTLRRRTTPGAFSVGAVGRTAVLVVGLVPGEGGRVDRGFGDGDALGAVAHRVRCLRWSVCVLSRKVRVGGVVVRDGGWSREGKRLLRWSGVHGRHDRIVSGFRG